VPMVMAKTAEQQPLALVSRKTDIGYRNGAYASFAIGGASLATGTVLAVLGYLDVRKAGSLNRVDYINQGGDTAYESAFNSLKKTGQTKGYVGYGMLGLGVVGLGTGIILYVLSDGDSGISVLPTGPGGLGITASTRW